MRDNDDSDAVAYALLGFDPSDLEDEDDDIEAAPFGIGQTLACLRRDADEPLFGLPPVNHRDATILKFPLRWSRKEDDSAFPPRGTAP